MVNITLKKIFSLGTMAHADQNNASHYSSLALTRSHLKVRLSTPTQRHVVTPGICLFTDCQVHSAKAFAEGYNSVYARNSAGSLSKFLFFFKRLRAQKNKRKKI